jgi:adhesin/invasin
VARVTYAGLAPGFAGLYQVNAEVPPGTAAGLQSLIIASGGASSNAVAISIR